MLERLKETSGRVASHHDVQYRTGGGDGLEVELRDMKHGYPVGTVRRKNSAWAGYYEGPLEPGREEATRDSQPTCEGEDLGKTVRGLIDTYYLYLNDVLQAGEELNAWLLAQTVPEETAEPGEGDQGAGPEAEGGRSAENGSAAQPAGAGGTEEAGG